MTTPATKQRQPIAGHIGAEPQIWHCCFCGRSHAPEPMDEDRQAVVSIVELVWRSEYDGNLPGIREFAPLCARCLPHMGAKPAVLEVREISPLIQLQHVDAEVADDLSGLLSATAPQDEWRREEWRVVADRILYRLAQDEAELDEAKAACELEVALVRANYARNADVIERRAWWRRNALESIAQALFANEEDRTRGGRKSVQLTHGTIGRKDYKPAPELVDETAALAACRSAGYVDAIRVVESLAWGVLKKRLAESGEVLAGTQFSPARTEWIATPTKVRE